MIPRLLAQTVGWVGVTFAEVVGWKVLEVSLCKPRFQYADKTYRLFQRLKGLSWWYSLVWVWTFIAFKSKCRKELPSFNNSCVTNPEIIMDSGKILDIVIWRCWRATSSRQKPILRGVDSGKKGTLNFRLLLAFCLCTGSSWVHGGQLKLCFKNTYISDCRYMYNVCTRLMRAALVLWKQP